MDDDEDDNWGDSGDDSFNDAPDFGDDDDDDGGGVESKFSGKEYQVLCLTEALAAKNALVSDVADTLNLSHTKASMLLRKNGWNKERLVSAYFEDAAKVEAQAGLVKEGSGGSQGEEAEVECAICSDDVAWADTHALGCGHRYCKECWGDYLEDRISKGKEGVFSQCPGLDCSVMVDDDSIELLVDATWYGKYATAIVRSFVEDSNSLRWCPAPRCENSVKAHGHVLTVTCDCSFKFCFNCNEEAHEPSTCKDLRLWLEKCQNESETAHWIIANTKKCPKCNVRIEKNQGCNHFTCQNCKHDFCWVCMGAWKDHGDHSGGFYKCNKYDPKNIKGGKPGTKATSEEEAKMELDRYLHYYKRYHSHDQAKKFAAVQRKEIEERMSQLQASSSTSTWVDVQFLKAAMEVVFECRQVLKYTYVFAFYLQGGPEKDLFEYLQQELEKNTERLSELSESRIEKVDRTEVVNFTRVTQRFMKNLLDGVAQGLTQA